MSSILTVKHLDISYRVGHSTFAAVRDVSFHLKRGSVLAIVGESGSGKSSICRAIMRTPGNTMDVKGEIWFKDRQLLALSKKEMRKLYSREISLLPQTISSLNPLLKIGTHIKETLAVSEGFLAKNRLKREALCLLSQFQLPESERVYHSYPFQLSGGLNQRAMMSIVFSHNPQLVIADEPTRSLDVALRDEIINVIKMYQKNNSLSMLLITHDLYVAKALSDKTAIIYNGRVVEYGKTRDVFEHPGHPYTQSLVQALPENGLKATWGYAPGLTGKNQECDFKPRCPHKKRCTGNIQLTEFAENHRVWCSYAKN